MNLYQSFGQHFRHVADAGGGEVFNLMTAACAGQNYRRAVGLTLDFFGMQASKYELSLKIAEPLIEKIKHQPYGTTVVLSGTSCRHQVEHLVTARVRHMAEVLAEALM